MSIVFDITIFPLVFIQLNWRRSENFVFSQLSAGDDLYQKIRFWRSQSKKEVDFIWQISIENPYPIEVKLQYPAKQRLPSGLKSFISLYAPARAFIIHTGGFNTFDFKGTRVFVVPAWAI